MFVFIDLTIFRVIFSFLPPYELLAGNLNEFVPQIARSPEVTALRRFSINLLVGYRESVNLIGYVTRRLSADSQQL